MSDKDNDFGNDKEAQFCTAESTNNTAQNLLRMWCQKHENQQLEHHYEMKEAFKRDVPTHTSCGDQDNVEKYSGFCSCPFPHSLGLLSSSNFSDNTKHERQGRKSTTSNSKSKRLNVKSKQCVTKEPFIFKHGMSADEYLQEYREKFIYTRSRLTKVDKQAIQIALATRNHPYSVADNKHDKVSHEMGEELSVKSESLLDWQHRNTMEVTTKNNKETLKKDNLLSHHSTNSERAQISEINKNKNENSSQLRISTHGKPCKIYKKHHMRIRQPITLNVINVETFEPTDFNTIRNVKRRNSYTEKINTGHVLKNVSQNEILCNMSDRGNSQVIVRKNSDTQQKNQITMDTLLNLCNTDENKIDAELMACNYKEFTEEKHDESQSFINPLSASQVSLPSQKENTNGIENNVGQPRSNSKAFTNEVVDHIIEYKQRDEINECLLKRNADTLNNHMYCEVVQYPKSDRSYLKPYTNENSFINKEQDNSKHFTCFGNEKIDNLCPSKTSSLNKSASNNGELPFIVSDSMLKSNITEPMSNFGLKYNTLCQTKVNSKFLMKNEKNSKVISYSMHKSNADITCGLEYLKFVTHSYCENRILNSHFNNHQGKDSIPSKRNMILKMPISKRSIYTSRSHNPATPSIINVTDNLRSHNGSCTESKSIGKNNSSFLKYKQQNMMTEVTNVPEIWKDKDATENLDVLITKYRNSIASEMSQITQQMALRKINHFSKNNTKSTSGEQSKRSHRSTGKSFSLTLDDMSSHGHKNLSATPTKYLPYKFLIPSELNKSTSSLCPTTEDVNNMLQKRNILKQTRFNLPDITSKSCFKKLECETHFIHNDNKQETPSKTPRARVNIQCNIQDTNANYCNDDINVSLPLMYKNENGVPISMCTDLDVQEQNTDVGAKKLILHETVNNISKPIKKFEQRKYHNNKNVGTSSSLISEYLNKYGLKDIQSMKYNFPFSNQKLKDQVQELHVQEVYVNDNLQGKEKSVLKSKYNNKLDTNLYSTDSQLQNVQSSFTTMKESVALILPPLCHDEDRIEKISEKQVK